MLEKKYLFAPGPVMTSARVKKAALEPDICHRRPAFEQCYFSIRKKLVKLLGGRFEDYTAIVVSGSGTAANETVLSSVCPENGRVLLVSNGEFGGRLKSIIECYGFGLHLLEFAWGQYPDLGAIESALRTDKKIAVISMVFHETSTGMINPVEQVGVLAKKYHKIFHVDAISAVGGEHINVEENNIDFCTGVPNKALSGQPGVSFVVAKRRRLAEIQLNKQRNLYLNLQHHIRIAEDCNQTPNTPSVVMFLTLNEALDELLEEGLEEQIERYRKNAAIIRSGLKDLGLNLLLNDDSPMANTVTSVFLPSRIAVQDFLFAMEQEGYVFYPGKGQLLAKNMFQIANMGKIYPEDCITMLEVVRRVLAERYGHKGTETPR